MTPILYHRYRLFRTKNRRILIAFLLLHLQFYVDIMPQNIQKYVNKSLSPFLSVEFSIFGGFHKIFVVFFGFSSFQTSKLHKNILFQDYAIYKYKRNLDVILGDLLFREHAKNAYYELKIACRRYFTKQDRRVNLSYEV